MKYEPASVREGFKIAGAAGLVLIAWMAGLFLINRRKPDHNRQGITSESGAV
jgi:hypothetical protein